MGSRTLWNAKDNGHLRLPSEELVNQTPTRVVHQHYPGDINDSLEDVSTDPDVFEDRLRDPTDDVDLHHDHAAVYERGAEINLFSEAFGDRLLELWKTNRAAVYYREAAATAEQADAMLELATTIHEHVLRFSSVEYECICS